MLPTRSIFVLQTMILFILHSDKVLLPTAQICDLYVAADTSKYYKDRCNTSRLLAKTSTGERLWGPPVESIHHSLDLSLWDFSNMLKFKCLLANTHTHSDTQSLFSVAKLRWYLVSIHSKKSGASRWGQMKHYSNRKIRALRFLDKFHLGSVSWL